MASNSTGRDTGSDGTQGGSGDDLEARAQNARSGATTLVCVPGLVIALGSAIATIFAGVGADVISGGAVWVARGILGYYLGAGRLGVATIVVSVLAMFAGLSTSLPPAWVATTASCPPGNRDPARARVLR